MATKRNTEILAILGEWKRLRLEGVTQKQFCQERGLSVRTLRDWQRRFEPKTASPAEMIAKAQVVIDELQTMIDALRSGAHKPPPAWQRWLLDEACP
ncbi:MAG: helix-turn-helix domain containing protein [Myxococcaceae bacterium]|nr:helix-turn-helix domain containing protein [Myxococcaceae bacterium]